MISFLLVSSGYPFAVRNGRRKKPPEAFGHLFQRVTQLPPSGIEKIENCAVLPKEFWVHFCPQKNVYANRKPVQWKI